MLEQYAGCDLLTKDDFLAAERVAKNTKEVKEDAAVWELHRKLGIYSPKFKLNKKEEKQLSNEDVYKLVDAYFSSQVENLRKTDTYAYVFLDEVIRRGTNKFANLKMIEIESDFVFIEDSPGAQQRPK